MENKGVLIEIQVGGSRFEKIPTKVFSALIEYKLEDEQIFIRTKVDRCELWGASSKINKYLSKRIDFIPSTGDCNLLFYGLFNIPIDKKKIVEELEKHRCLKLNEGIDHIITILESNVTFIPQLN